MAGMLRRLAHGMIWTYTSLAIGAGVQLAVTASTARLLDPRDFGLVAMVQVLLQLSSYIAHMGVGRAIVQKPEVTEEDVRAAFTASAIFGFLVTGVLVLLAPLAAGFYQTQAVIPILRAMAFVFTLRGFGMTARALLQRQLRFRSAGVVEVVSYALGYGLPTLVMAALGFGAWSLVAGALGQAAVGTGLAYVLTRHPVRISLAKEVHRRLLGFGATVSFLSFCTFIGSIVDTLIVGRFGSAANLGLYNRAMQLARLPTFRLNEGIAKVLVPVLAGGQDDLPAFRHTLARVTDLAIRVLVSAAVGMALAAPEMVTVVLGERWQAAVPVFAVLAVYASMHLLALFPNMAAEALGKVNRFAVVQLVYVLVLTPALLIVVLRGELDLRAVALTVAVATALRMVAYYVIGVGLLQMYTYRQLGRHLATGALCCVLGVVLVGGPLWAVRAAGWPPALRLAVAVAGGGVQLLILFPWKEAKKLLQRWRQRQAERKQPKEPIDAA